MKLSNEWWTCPTQAENGKLIMVTGRDDIDKVRQSGRYDSRIDVSWNYNALPDGMPDVEDALLMEQAHEALLAVFKANPVAVMTGVYTGDGRRDWVFYTRNLRVFGGLFNKALEDLPVIPLVIEAEADPDWEEYANMRELTYMPPGE